MFDWVQQLTPPANVTGSTLTAYVLFDLLLIIALARVLGSLMARVGQPRVVGEILAGLLLGPTFLGSNLSQVIAPLQVRPVLSAIATLGLLLFMFIAGVEFDTSRVNGRARQAGLLAVLAVGVPALLGFPVAQAMHTATYAGPAGAKALPFALMMGAALSVTAFPVMAHILMERGELNTSLGALSVATAGIMSVLMFTYIAFASAVAAANGLGGLLWTLLWIGLFVAGSWYVVRPLTYRVLCSTVHEGAVSGNGMGIVFGGMLVYGLIAHLIGINALVGGFAWGMILPADADLRKTLTSKVRDLAMVHFLPVFFAMSGFAADLKLLTPQTLPVVGLVLLGAVGGKFLAVMPARAFGMSWGQVGTLGALFNTRGLLVLVVGLIGLQHTIITNLTFTILVVVALVTNLMTLPLLNLFAQRPAQVAPMASGERI
jgi:Kef-type K+ transport system membrane component KefB